MPVVATPGIRQDLGPDGCREHRFGLPVERWTSLAGQAFWITGAGTGYGQSIAIALAVAGATVFLTGRRLAKLDDTRQRAAQAGADIAKLIAVPADITDPAAVTQAARDIAAHGTNLRGLISNAALPQPRSSPHPLADLPVEDWDRLLKTNITGQWLMTRAALPLLSAADGFRIVFMTSEAGWAFTPGFGPYNLTKAAVNNLGASLAAECAARMPGSDVQINVLIPGEARTEMNQGSTDSPCSVACMTLLLLSHPASGPNGCFFHRDGRHFEFAYAPPHPHSLMHPAIRLASMPDPPAPGIRAQLRALAGAIVKKLLNR